MTGLHRPAPALETVVRGSMTRPPTAVDTRGEQTLRTPAFSSVFIRGYKCQGCPSPECHGQTATEPTHAASHLPNSPSGLHPCCYHLASICSLCLPRPFPNHSALSASKPTLLMQLQPRAPHAGAAPQPTLFPWIPCSPLLQVAWRPHCPPRAPWNRRSSLCGPMQHCE